MQLQLKPLCLALSILFFSTINANASAISIPFTDTHANWKNWGVQSGNQNGTPDFLDGTAIIDNGFLTELSFRVKANKHISEFRTLTAADLFLDSNADDTWDYVVKSLNTTGGTYDLYSINQPLGAYNPGDPANTNYTQALHDKWRKYHPVGLDINDPTISASLTGSSATLSGWWDSSAQIGDIYNLTWSLDPIALGENFTFGFSVMCANDVVYETLSTLVPEPASLLLLVSGLVGMIGLKRWNK